MMKRMLGRLSAARAIAVAASDTTSSAAHTFMERIIVFFLAGFGGYGFFFGFLGFFGFFLSRFALITGTTSPSSGWFQKR